MYVSVECLWRMARLQYQWSYVGIEVNKMKDDWRILGDIWSTAALEFRLFV